MRGVVRAPAKRPTGVRRWPGAIGQPVAGPDAPLPARLRLMAFNVNGLRAGLAKGLDGMVAKWQPDVLFIGETRVGAAAVDAFLGSPAFLTSQLAKYRCLLATSVDRQGYAGTACFVAHHVPVASMTAGSTLLGRDDIINSEGRLIRLRLPGSLSILHVYAPNSGRGPGGFLRERIAFEARIRQLIRHEQDAGRSVVYCGDLNVAAAPIDVFEWEKHLGTPGFTAEERAELGRLQEECSMVDTFRHLHPHEAKYSWFSNFGGARRRKEGWRIDYFMVDRALLPRVASSDVLDSLCNYSDHVPVVMELLL